MVYPIDKWVLMLIEAGAKVENLGDVKWCATTRTSSDRPRALLRAVRPEPVQASLPL